MWDQNLCFYWLCWASIPSPRPPIITIEGRGHVRLGCHPPWVNNKPPTSLVADRESGEVQRERSGDDTGENTQGDSPGGLLTT